MPEKYRKELICIKYNINCKKNQEVKSKKTDMRCSATIDVRPSNRKMIGNCQNKVAQPKSQKGLNHSKSIAQNAKKRGYKLWKR